MVYKIRTNSEHAWFTWCDSQFFRTSTFGEGALAANWEPPLVEPILEEDGSGSENRLDSDIATHPEPRVKVLSPRAVTLLRPLCDESTTEFLPLANTDRMLLHVFKRTDCLDLAHSEVEYYPSNPERVMDVQRYVFDLERLPFSHGLFRIREAGGLFAQEHVVKAINAAGLQGVEFQPL